MATRRKRPVPRQGRAGAIRPARATELRARKLLLELIRQANIDLMAIVDLVAHGEIGQAQALAALEQRIAKWKSVLPAAAIAAEWVETASKYSRDRLQERIAVALGVGMTHIFDDQTVREAAEIAAKGAIAKITSVKNEYLDEVYAAVLQNYRQIPFKGGMSLTQVIQKLTGVSFKKARFIARHQNSVITSGVNRARQIAVGIEEYFWETALDEKVVGNPNGKYPKGNDAHGDHWSRDWRNNGNKAYRWDEPFHDGFPGEPPNDRCVARPKIVRDKLTDRVLI